jgi:CheY-like chemotaxis protein
MRSLFDAAVARARLGETTLDEVERVVGLPSDGVKGAEADADAPSDAAAVAKKPAGAKPGSGIAGAKGGAAAAAGHSGAAPKGDAAARDAAASPAAKPLRILVVDDEPVNRKVARSVLQKNGYEVVECVNGEESVQRLKADPDFSLVLLDLDMPKMDGRQVLKWVRETPSTRPLPVVVFTATGGEGTEAEVMDEGADDYIQKPIDPVRFVARIRATLRRAAA